MSTLKHRLANFVLPKFSINRRSFNSLRYEIDAFLLGLRNLVSVSHRRTVSDLKNRKDLSVNLGSGGKGQEGWVNVEFKRAKDSTLVLDLRKPIPLADDSASRILLEHVLEHLDYFSDAKTLLHEVFRILKPGGVFRVIVPDCEKFVKAYVSRDIRLWDELGWACESLPDDIPTQMAILNHVFHQQGEHLFGYDFETLAHLLESFGFERIERMSFRKSLDPKLAIDQPNHEKYSLYVDAVKPESVQ